MGEENQNTTVSLRDKTRQFLDFQMNARKQQAQDFWLKRAKQQQDLYTSWLNSTNTEISKQCTKAVRVGQIAEWIRDYFSRPENWWEDYSNIEDVPLVDNYISLNPDRKAQLYDYVLEDNQICDPTQLYTDMGWISEEETAQQESEWNTWVNRAWWLTESVLWIPKFAWKIWADLAEWSIKLLGGDEERATAAGDKIRWFIDKIWFWDEESSAYQNTNLIWDFGQLLIPWWQYKAPAILAKFPKFTNVLTKVAKNAEKYPKLTSLLKLWWQWAVDTVKYNAINQEYTDPIEAWAGWLINILFGKWWEALNKVSDKLRIWGIMNTSKASEVIDAIKKEWWTIDDLSGWLSKRWFKWSKDEIKVQLEKWASDAKQLKDELFSTVDDKFDSKETTKILNAIIKNKKWVIWQEETIKTLKTLVSKDNKYSLSEMQRILRELDNSPLNPYKLNKVWEPKLTETADWMAKLRDKVKTLIEKTSDDLWLWDIKSLNNEIVVASKAAEWIWKKSLSESIREWLWWLTIPAAIVWYLQEWDLWWILKYWWATMAAKMLWWTKFRTYIADAIKKLSWEERVWLTKWLWSNWEKALTEKESKILWELLEKADEWTKGEIQSLLTEWVIDLTRKWWIVGWVELTDMIRWE